MHRGLQRLRTMARKDYTEADMEDRKKFSLGYYIITFSLILFLETIFFSGTAVKEISYSKFKNLIRMNKIQNVIIEPDRIYGLEKGPATEGKTKPDCCQC